MFQQVCSTADIGAWSESLQGVCGLFETQPAREHSLFVGDLRYRDFGPLRLARIRTNAERLAYRAPGSGRLDDRWCFLVMQTYGRSRIRQDGVLAELAPGGMALIDPTRSCEILPQGLMEHASLHLERSRVQAMLDGGARSFGRIGAGSLSARLLRGLIEQLVDTAPAPRESFAEEGAALQEALLQLLAPAWKRAPPQWPGEGEDADSAALLREQARRLIDECLADPCLGPKLIAQRLGTSLRQVHRLFQDSEHSLSRYIQSRRLECAARNLGDPALAARSITELAYKWGFTDSTHFSRSFKRRYDCSPREYRNRAFAAR
ncbi:AraC family transcriptional activator of tynA and feaB [Lysobacter enzymogenes]|uniref:transcriptional regulator FeaR n=1 Tax=Lysobacter enzymogenes TaxID=69 RepID=UPI00339397DF